ncbi:hypothetical protein P9158_15060, partial [Bacillus thuringiensis]
MKKKTLYKLLLMIMTFVTMPITAYAWDWGEFFGTKDIDVQKTMAFLNNDWIQYANFIGAIIQSFEGSVIKLLLTLVSLLEGLIPDTFSLFDLLQNAGLNEFATSIMKGLFLALLVLVLTYLGLRTIIFHKPPRFKSVGINIIVMVGLLGGLNELMVDMQKMSIDFYKASTDGSKTKDGLAWELVKHNTADLLYLSQSGFDPIMGKDSSKNNLTKDDFLKADLGDLLTVKVMDELSKGEAGLAEETKFLTYKLTHTGKEATVTKIEKASAFNPFKDSFESGYIRYPMNFWINFFSLLSLGVAYLFTLFVFVMTIFELGMKKIVAPLVFVTDLETGEKTKMVLKDIGSAFLTFAFTGLSLRFYSIAVNYLGDAKLNPVLYVVAMICLTIALIKGSESIMKYFGVDVGLKEGKNNLMAAVGTVASINGLRKGATNFGKNMKDKLTGGNGQTRDNSPKRSGGNENELNELGTEENNVSTSRGSGGKGMVRNVGATLGYARNRGAGGMLVDAGVKTMDAVSGALDKGKEKASNVASDTVGTFKSGQAEGRQVAQQNADRDTLGKVAKGIIKNANSGVDQNGTEKMDGTSYANKQQVEQGNPQGIGQASQDEHLRSKQMLNVEKQQVEQANPQGIGQASQDEHLRRKQMLNVEKQQVEQANLQGTEQASQDEHLRRKQMLNVEKQQVEQANPQGTGQASQNQNLRSLQTMHVEKQQVEQGTNPMALGGTLRAESQRVVQETKVENKVVQGANPTVSGGSLRAESQRAVQETKVENKVVQGVNPTVSGGSVRAESQRAVQETKVENKVVQGANPTVSGGSVRAESQRAVQETKVENKVVQGANPMVSGGSVRAESQRAVL